MAGPVSRVRDSSVPTVTASWIAARARAGVQEPVRLRAADAELRLAVRLPARVPERNPDAGGVRVTDLGGEHRHGAPDVVHRLPQPGRYLPAAGRGERRPRRFGGVAPALVASAHNPMVLRAGGLYQDGQA